MNIPQDTLQAVADAAFAATQDKYHDSLVYKQDHPLWEHESPARRAVIQHALDNPALATFLAAMPRSDESPAIADLKSDLDGWKDRAVSLEGQVNEAIARAEKAEAELAAIKSSLPAAEDTPPAEPAADATTIAKCAINNTEQNVQFRATAGYGTWGAAEPEPAAQVPLGPEDVKPGSVFTFGAAAVWITPLCVSSDGVGFPETEPDKPLIQKFSFGLLQETAEINTSIPDTGRWDANAWRSCSKPGKEPTP